MFLFDKETKNKSGVYAIINKVNNKLYVGSASCFYNRLHAHYSELINNKHANSYLQNSWNEYGEESFYFEIIEFVDIIENKDLLIEREQYWLDYYQSYIRDKGYNLQPCSKNALGYKHSEETKKKLSKLRSGKGNHNYGKVTPPEVREKISESLKGKMLGVKFTEDHKRKISKANRGKKMSDDAIKKSSESRKGMYIGEKNPSAKLTINQVIEIREKYTSGNYSYSDLGKEYGVDRMHIGSIIRRKTWKHI